MSTVIATLTAQLADRNRRLDDAVAVIKEFMPNIGRCVIQDYERLNRVLCEHENSQRPKALSEEPPL